METPANINEAVLLRYFSGQLDAEEKQAVERWLDESEENRKTGRDVCRLCLSADALEIMRSADSRQALEQVKKRIRPARHTLLYKIQQIAAILFVPLLLASLWFLLKKEPTRYVELRTNPGMIAAVDLPDGSRVWLNSETTFRHPAEFTGATREVELDGEAYFSVQKNKKRFIVHTPQQVNAEVLGTEFNIEAYRNGDCVTTTLVSGSVRLAYRGKDDKKESVTIKPDERVVYDLQTKSIAVSKPYIPTQVAWKDGIAVFRNTPFKEVLHILSKRFNVEFVVKNPSLYENSFTGPFEGQHLQLILEHFRLSSGIRYKILDPEPGAGKAIRQKITVELY
ncbi:MAG: FecR domain-containing protein [Parabacteroides sp.]|nr:FecR domain-containing protein [Parabacteroides sp.]